MKSQIMSGTPTQVAHPWRATVRTAVQVTVALATLTPFLIDAIGLDKSLPIIGGVLAVSAAVTRVATLPQVESFLARFVPWLATGVHTEQEQEQGEKS